VAAVGALAVLSGGAIAVATTRGSSSTPPNPPNPIATAKVTRTNLTATQLINATLGYAPSQPVILRRTGTYTTLPVEGTIVKAGDAVAWIDNRPVIALSGTVPAWRRLSQGVTDGPDVAQLQQGLTALGFGAGLKVDSHFDWTTSSAVRRWQTALGLTATGAVEEGDVVFLPSPFRVGLLAAAVGGIAEPGQTPYSTTSTNRVVQASLDASRLQGITVGLAVTVDLLDGTRLSGKVSALRQVAATPQSNVIQTNSAQPTVLLTITLDGLAPASALNEEPAQVEVVTDSRTNVLAVPVTALLALAEGGYGVEVVPAAGAHGIVAVKTGLFASGLVEVTSGDVTAGTVVVVAK
jgi:peptidoglycan hydrolase-like protein with peptidoglycan-binding domain